MSLVKGSPENDFKLQNPVLCTLGRFATVYKTEKEPSKLCWSVFMIEEEKKSINPLAGLNKNQRVEEVIKTYYAVDVESEIYKELARDYKNYALTKEENLYGIQMRKLEQISLYIDSLDPTVNDNYDKVLKYFEKISKIWESLDKVREKMIEAANKTNIRGNAKQSQREKRDNK
jgi:hypothetical protein